MREWLAEIPGLFWIALLFTLMSLWVGDIRGIVIALICAVLGTLQMVRQK